MDWSTFIRGRMLTVRAPVVCMARRGDLATPLGLDYILTCPACKSEQLISSRQIRMSCVP